MKRLSLLILVSSAVAFSACRARDDAPDDRAYREARREAIGMRQEATGMGVVVKAEPARVAPAEGARRQVAEPGERHPGLTNPAAAAETAPATFAIELNTTKGNIVIDVTRAWSPNGADRIYNLVKIGFYNDVAFFRVLEGFMAQVGLNGDPAVNRVWRAANIQDDERTQSNTRGMVSFAMTNQRNSRSTQFFINYGDNSNLDGMRFTPFGRVRDMTAADALYNGYGEGAPRGRGPDQSRVTREGNTYLRANFPELDYIRSARILP